MSQSSYPLVSVLMPCYNHERYVATAIASVLEQTYKNIELIIIDDGSTDETWREIEKFAHLPNVFAKRQANKGLIETLKELRGSAKGEFLTILASDDKFYPIKIERMIAAFRDQPGAALCVGRTDIIDKEGAVRGLVRGEYNGKGNLFLRLCNGLTYVSSVATLVKTDVYRTVDFIDPYIEDLPAWLQISRDWPAIAIGDVVASYRHVEGSMSRNVEKMITSEMRIVSAFLPRDHGNRFPLGWSGRWFKAYAGQDSRKALFFLLTEQCGARAILTLDFYKGIVKIVRRLGGRN